MAYKFDPYDNALVLDGHENGIAEDPFSGIADMRNANIISVPGEASVGFSTSRASQTAIPGGTITSADGTSHVLTFTGASGLENYMAITFSAQSGLNVSTNTVYWIDSLSGSTFKLYSDYQKTNLVAVTNGTGTFTVYNMSQIMHFAHDTSAANTYWCVDFVGQVWSNVFTTTSGYWTYTGNQLPGSTRTAGNGLVYYQGSDGTGWIFVIHNSSIDYTPSASSNISWVYQWDPAAGTAAGYNVNPTRKLKSTSGSTNTHLALLAPDSRVYFCDSNWIDRFYQADPSTAFDPGTKSTYVWDQTALLPTTDVAQCLTFLGTNLLIGGQQNVLYPWDRFSSNFSYPILLAESNTTKLITVNTNAYAFTGNRGRIYITNGSQAQLYKKIPDHISNTVEPYFIWGGVASIKNQLYFSATVTNNATTAEIKQYGGLWAIDLDTKAMRLSNKLSYATYAGYATAMIPQLSPSSNTAGSGIISGWSSVYSVNAANPFGETPAFGIDIPSGNPYTGSQTTIDYDLIPIGTFVKPRDLTMVEYKLTKPMVSGESVTIKYRLDFSQSYATILTDSTVGNFSNNGPVNFKNAQWLQIQVVLNSTTSSPSYTRLKQIRLMGFQIPSL